VIGALLAGLAVGAIYVLVALGYDIVLLASGTFNFAQAALVMLGTFLASHFGVEQGLNSGYVILISAAIGAVTGIIIELIAIRPVAGKGMHGELVTTIGVLVALQGIITLIWGPNVRPVNPLISERIVTILGGRITIDAIALIIIAIVASAALWAWSRFTLGGIASLAASEDRQAAALRGVNVNHLSILALAASGALGAGAGPIVGPQTLAVVTVAAAVSIKAFLALTIGGFGSFPGAVIGGFAVGIVEAVSERYINGDYSPLVLFVVLLAVLLLWPSGLFGQRARRSV
jgi:branched-chain amino acid transport system permease protein